MDPAEVIAAFPEFGIETPALGSGGFKDAFLATRDADQVVLKVIRAPMPEHDENDEVATLPARLEREVRLMQAIDSPRIVRILGDPEIRTIGDSKHLWYLEEFYANGTLEDKLNEPWETDAVLRLCDELLGALEVLDEHGIVHRDIKPHNIAVRDDGSIVLLDLGIAFVADETDLTQPDEVAPRTTMYAAPEQFEPRLGIPLDVRTDLFLVAVVCFQAWTGRHPFNPEQEGFLQRLGNGDYDRQALEAKPNSPELKAFLDRCLRPHRNERYRDLSKARAALEGGAQ